MAVPEPLFLYAVRFAADYPEIRINSGVAQSVILDVRAGEDYYLSGDGAATDLVQKLEDALNTNTDGVTFTVTISSRNFITIAASVASSVLWGNVLTTVDPTLFGFVAATVGPSVSITAPNQTKGVWIPGTSSRSVGKLDDTYTESVTVGALMEAEDGSCRGYDLSSSRGERTILFHLIDRAKILTEFAPATEPYGALQYAWTNGATRGREWRVYNDRTVRTTTNYMRARMRTRERPWSKMPSQFLQRYEVRLDMREVT